MKTTISFKEIFFYKKGFKGWVERLFFITPLVLCMVKFVILLIGKIYIRNDMWVEYIDYIISMCSKINTIISFKGLIEFKLSDINASSKAKLKSYVSTKSISSNDVKFVVVFTLLIFFITYYGFEGSIIKACEDCIQSCSTLCLFASHYLYVAKEIRIDLLSQKQRLKKK